LANGNFFDCGGGAFAFAVITPSLIFDFGLDPYAAKAAASLLHRKGARRDTLAE
jgi:hypothetical protein